MHRTFSSLFGSAPREVREKNPVKEIIKCFKDARCNELVVIDGRGRFSNPRVLWKSKAIFTIVVSGNTKDLQSVTTYPHTVGLACTPFYAAIDFVKKIAEALREEKDKLALLHVLMENEAMGSEFFSLCWPNNSFIRFYQEMEIMRSVVEKQRRYTGPTAHVDTQVIKAVSSSFQDAVNIRESTPEYDFSYSKRDDTFTLNVQDKVQRKTIEIAGIDDKLLDFNPKDMQSHVLDYISTWNKITEANGLTDEAMIEVPEDFFENTRASYKPVEKPTVWSNSQLTGMVMEHLNSYKPPEEPTIQTQRMYVSPSQVPVMVPTALKERGKQQFPVRDNEPRKVILPYTIEGNKGKPAKDVSQMIPRNAYPPNSYKNYIHYATMLNLATDTNNQRREDPS